MLRGVITAWRGHSIAQLCSVIVERPVASKKLSTRKWLWLSGTLLVLMLAAGGAVTMAHSAFTVDNVRTALEEASGRPVLIEKFSKSLFPPGCTAEGIRFLRHKHPGLSPVITIDKLRIRASLTGLLRSPKRLASVHVMGMHMIIGAKQPDEGPEHVALNAGPRGNSIAISEITADGAVLEFVGGGGKHGRYVLKVDKLAATNVGSGAPMHYRVELTNTVPPGVIRAEGKFGPWNPDHIGATRVSGTYFCEQMELSHFHSIYGVAHARGEFSGPLDRILTHGSVGVAGFGVEGTHHAVPVTIDYRAIVNGTNGDVLLDPAVARFRHTRLEVRGWISGKNGDGGKAATFDLAVPQGRVDDLLAMFDGGRPGMSGSVALRGHFVWPPGPAAFLRKIRMDLTCGIDHSRFANWNTQGSISRLSQSAEGESKDEIEEDPRTVLLAIRGGIRVRNGVATITNAAFHVPGADATIEGTYGLIDQNVNLKGTLDTRGHVSETTSGVKALLLKAVTPLFRKHAKERVVPFRITGMYRQTKVSIDWKKLM